MAKSVMLSFQMLNGSYRKALRNANASNRATLVALQMETRRIEKMTAIGATTQDELTRNEMIARDITASR